MGKRTTEADGAFSARGFSKTAPPQTPWQDLLGDSPGCRRCSRELLSLSASAQHSQTGSASRLSVWLGCPGEQQPAWQAMIAATSPSDTKRENINRSFKILQLSYAEGKDAANIASGAAPKAVFQQLAFDQRRSLPKLPQGIELRKTDLQMRPLGGEHSLVVHLAGVVSNGD